MSPTIYRGRHPHRIESVFSGNDGLFRCRLNDGALYYLYPSSHTSKLPKPGDELSSYDPDAYVYEGQSEKRRAAPNGEGARLLVPRSGRPRAHISTRQLSRGGG